MWKRFLTAFSIAFGGGLAAVLLLLFLVDPISVSPIVIVSPKPGYALKNRRFLAPQVVRSGRFDSFLVGTSTIHSVDPNWAEAAFGGHFANLAIHGATPYETAAVVTLIGHSVTNLRRIVLGLDVAQWCNPAIPARYNDKAVFPDELYDADRLNDWPKLLNGKMLETALRQLAVDLQLRPAPVPANGYRNELDEAKWRGFRSGAGRCLSACDQAATAADGGKRATGKSQSGSGSFPALKVLEQVLGALPDKAQVIAVLMPPHVSSMPSAAQERAERELCKQRIALLAGDKLDAVIDFDVPSSWTKPDQNYWDTSHFRLVIAAALMRRVKEAVDGRRDAEDGVYRYLFGRAAPASR